MREIDLMFNNAKVFNEDESQIFKDSVQLQEEAHRLAHAEKNKPDDEYAAGEGRIPRPQGIDYKGERWVVGDWVHIRNANDITKPIVGQIYRTWEDTNGQEWFNACWYYRPEQTVHHFEKHFWPNEVFKTGQYRDHRIEELVDHCFVMFYTRFTRGRPRGLPPEREVHVCEARYNEERHKINKIKTWASCLPDEVRDRDYEMDLFDPITSRKIKKQPSPLLGMFKDNMNDASNPPKPQWGAENAPPIIGGIFKGSRDENVSFFFKCVKSKTSAHRLQQSPPPEPTPEPTPQQTAPIRQINRTPSQENQGYRQVSEAKVSTDNINRQMAIPNTSQASNAVNAYAAQLQTRAAQVASPLYRQQVQSSQRLPQSIGLGTPAQSQDTYTGSPYAQPARYSNAAAAGSRMEGAYYLHAAHAPFSEDVRNEFQTDENGHVIFFSQPPVHVEKEEDPPLKHSVKYRAAMIRRRMLERDSKRVINKEAEERNAKRQKTMSDLPKEPTEQDLARIWLKFIDSQIKGTEEIYKRDFGDRWKEVKETCEAKLVADQAIAKKAREDFEARQPTREKLWQEARDMFKPPKVYKDDINPGF
jgi:chromatin structure-remodeling complex subunit RSC1/2